MAVRRFLTLRTTALLQTQSPGSLGHSASKPRAQCLAAGIPETITATTMATETTETTATMATKTTETTVAAVAEETNLPGSRAPRPWSCMHDLRWRQDCASRTSLGPSDYFDVVREFYSGIPDAIILKPSGGDASTLDHCVFILPAADYDSTGHRRVSPHARTITELFHKEWHRSQLLSL
jgi:hypothetical protein